MAAVPIGCRVCFSPCHSEAPCRKAVHDGSSPVLGRKVPGLRKVHFDDRDIGTPAYLNLRKGKTVKNLLRSCRTRLNLFLLRANDRVAATCLTFKAFAIENSYSSPNRLN